MKTDDLIAALARNAAPQPRRTVEKRLGVAAAAGLAASAVLVLFAYGPRADLASIPTAAFLKALLMLSALAAAAWFALRAARPATRLGAAAAPALVALALCAVAAAVLTAVAPEGGRVAALLPVGFPPCLSAIPVAAVLPGIAVFWAVRSLGPTRLAPAGAAAGAVAGAVGGLAYCLHCPIDSAAYVLAWYPLAVALCACIGALLGPRLLRW